MKKINKNCAYFLAQASHDLRQPLQALMLYLDLFDTDELSPKQKNLWDKILKTTGNLKILLSNVLDFSKFEFGDIKLNKHIVNVGVILSDLGQEYKILAESKNINFEYNICNCSIFTDAVLLERILRNLISNAFKFTKDKVIVSCKENRDNIVIDIQDNGIGIKKDELPLIFDEFYQGSNACFLNNDGAGLGLSIVKKIADKLEIDINVQSAKGKGSNFSILIKKGHTLS
ncbi:MAG: HAMP domain-containing histidine kinase [Alphaproteobacteria bacterium]|nr:HAMP domain-containing histidine kinase [Alphaproteobacteria bacterium]